MSFEFHSGHLYAEEVSCAQLADEFGTPCYVYSRAALEKAFREYETALADCDHLICYAVKANSNLAVLDVLARQGAGFDIVSIGELERVIAAGGDPSKVVFSGVVKQHRELEQALLAGIRCFNIESAAELDALQAVAAELGLKAPISVRVNPDVDAQTHPYISTGLKENKFGVAIETTRELLRRASTMENISVVGLDCHIGSQLTDMAPLLEALDQLLSLIDDLATDGIAIHHLDLGGGIGVRYRDERPPEVSDYIAAVRKRVGERNLTLVFEPGRSIAAAAGILLTEVTYLKESAAKNFALVDAAMNDFLRPALYQAWLKIEAIAPSKAEARSWDVVGPVCETADFLGKERALALEAGSRLAVFDAGAYGFVMASNYNTRPRAAEVMVDGAGYHLVRQRETISDLIRGEHRLPD
ncbi:MAG: diaminopimelate decarboxylase [Pseudomonadota bacterium]